MAQFGTLYELSIKVIQPTSTVGVSPGTKGNEWSAYVFNDENLGRKK